MELRQNTSGQEIPIGPFLDNTDWDTEETGLTIANTDILIWKWGASSLVTKNSGGATHMSKGVYYCTLNSTDTNTLGPIEIYIHVAGAKFCVFKGSVVSQSYWDSKYGSDYLQDISYEVWNRVITGAWDNNSAAKTLRGLLEEGGYEGGYVYIDTINGSPGSVAWENGTVNDPTSNLADALSIASATGLTKFWIAAGSVITFTQNMDGYIFHGDTWVCNLNGQSVSGTYIRNAVINGNDTGSNSSATIYEGCLMTTNTLGYHRCQSCGFIGTVTLAESASYGYINCHHSTPGTYPVIDIGASIGDTTINLSNYCGGMEFHNIGANGTDSICIGGVGRILLDPSCTGGTINISGNMTLTDNSVGTVVNDDARVDINQINSILPDKTGYSLSESGIDDIFDEVVEGTYTMRQLLRIMSSILAGKLSGAATTSIVIRDINDTKNRVTADVDENGYRTSVTLDSD